MRIVAVVVCVALLVMGEGGVTQRVYAADCLAPPQQAQTTQSRFSRAVEWARQLLFFKQKDTTFEERSRVLLSGFRLGNLSRERAEEMTEQMLQINYLFCLDLPDNELRPFMRRVFDTPMAAHWWVKFALEGIVYFISSPVYHINAIINLFFVAVSYLLYLGFRAAVKQARWDIVGMLLLPVIGVCIFVIVPIWKAIRQSRTETGRYHLFHEVVINRMQSDRNEDADTTWHELVHGIFKLHEKMYGYELNDFVPKELYKGKKNESFLGHERFEVPVMKRFLRKKYDKDNAGNYRKEIYHQPRAHVKSIMQAYENPLDLVFFLSLNFEFDLAEEWTDFALQMRKASEQGAYASLEGVWRERRDLAEAYQRLREETTHDASGDNEHRVPLINRKLTQIVTDLPQLRAVERQYDYFRREKKDVVDQQVALFSRTKREHKRMVAEEQRVYGAA